MSDSPKDLLTSLRRHTRLLAFLGALITAVVFSSPAEIVLLLVGEAWLPSIPLLQILAVSTFPLIVFPVHATSVMALGEGAWHLKAEVIKKTFLIVSVLYSSTIGLSAIAWSLVLTALLELVVSAVGTRRFLSYQISNLVGDLVPSLFLCASTIYIVEKLSEYFALHSPALSLIVKLLIVLGMFIIAIIAFGRRQYPDVALLLTGMLRSAGRTRRSDG
jgi:O-antigen/teichoic acid export membrane protein